MLHWLSACPEGKSFRLGKGAHQHLPTVQQDPDPRITTPHVYLDPLEALLPSFCVSSFLFPPLPLSPFFLSFFFILIFLSPLFRACIPIPVCRLARGSRKRYVMIMRTAPLTPSEPMSTVQVVWQMVTLFVYLRILCWMMFKADTRAYPNRRFAGLVVVEVVTASLPQESLLSSVSASPT